MAGSLAVLLGLALVAAGIEQGDAIAALLVAAVIFAAVSRLAVENVRALMDFAPEERRTAIERAIRGLDPPVELRRLRLREVGGTVSADVAIGLPPAAVLSSSHHDADRVESAVHRVAPGSYVVVHTEPRTEADLRERVLATALADPAVRDAHDVAIYLGAREARAAVHLKFAADSTLLDAHAAARRVAASITAAAPELAEVHTHLEPLETPVVVRPTQATDIESTDLAATATRILGRAPVACSCQQTDHGPVAFLTIDIDDRASLTSAHDRASALERDLRLAHPALSDVVVHTRPSPAEHASGADTRDPSPLLT